VDIGSRRSRLTKSVIVWPELNSGDRMSLSDLASIGSFVSGIAVLVSLIYLSLQIRQNTKHSRALIQQGRAARICQTLTDMAELDWTDGMDACFAGESNVSPKELRKFNFVARNYFVSAEDSFLQHQEGLMDHQVFDGFEGSMRAGLSASPGFRKAWKLSRMSYVPAFRDYIDKLAAEAKAGGMQSALAAWNTTDI
jgi:hypothetical protein